ncbi:MAG: hypothetical protein QXT53_06265 [Ignisphaera sp.]
MWIRTLSLVFVASILVLVFVASIAYIDEAFEGAFYGVTKAGGVANTTLQKMCLFLESLFVDFGNGMGCLRESPKVEADVCYLNTNWLAVEVLRMCGSRIAPMVEAFLSHYNTTLYDDGNRLRILLFKDISVPPQTVSRLSLGSKKAVTGEAIYIYADVVSGSVLPDWLDYADLAILASLQELKNKNLEQIQRYKEHVKGMWLGIGFGDIAYSKSGLFETYKLSLYYFLMRALGQRDEIVEWIEDNINRFIVDGGVVTHYNGDLTPRGDPNVETTAITALALFSNYPEKFSIHKKVDYGFTTLILVGLGISAATTLLTLKVLKKRKRDYALQSLPTLPT